MESRNRRRRRQIGDPCKCLRPLIRIWGIFTAIVVCGVGVDVAVHGYNAGYYIVAASLIVFFLELKWVMTMFIQLCSSSNSVNGADNNTSCTNCWSLCRYFGGWHLTPPYIALGVALIIWPNNLWLSPIAGFQVIILAILRLCTLFRFNISNKDEGLLKYQEDSFDKYEHLQDVTVDAHAESSSSSSSGTTTPATTVLQLSAAPRGRRLEDEDAIDGII